jgi:hypothetical protein
MHVRRHKRLYLAVLPVLAALSGCHSRTVESHPVEGPAPQRQPADFVLLVDNSGSITPAEQALVREVAMLLADIADTGDSVSLIPFGEGAALTASTEIEGDRDRIAFKRAASQALHFKDQHSDIRAGLRLLADKRDKLLRAGATPVAILLSDGKLEPAGAATAGATQEAFSELQGIMAGPLARVGIFAVALGDTSCRDPILPGITGLDVMERFIARGHSRFYRAKSLDELLPVTVAILSRAKGVNSLGEQGRTVFRIDRDVESAMFIVRKKSTGGQTLCASSDIHVERRQPEPGAMAAMDSQSPEGLGASLYWAADYQYFDLIVIRKPQEGLWEVKLADGRTPEVLSKVVPGIEMRVSARERYWTNESDAVTAYLVERASGAASPAAYKVQARVAPAGGLGKSDVYVPMRAGSQPGQYVLDVPSGLGGAGGPGEFELEIVAERFKSAGSREMDPWFIRRSQPFKLEMAPPFVEWKRADERYTRVPFWKRRLNLGAFPAAAQEHSGAPEFETPPRLTVTLERFDSGRKTWAGAAPVTLEARGPDGSFSWSAELPGTGEYHYRYRLDGTIHNGGPFAIESPWFPMRVRFPWPEIGGAILLLWALISAARARVQGTVGLTLPSGLTDQCLVDEKEFDSLRFGDVDAAELRFRVRARRWLFFFKSMRLRVDAGNLTLPDGTILAAGQSRKLPSGPAYQLTGATAAGPATFDLGLSV